MNVYCSGISDRRPSDGSDQVVPSLCALRPLPESPLRPRSLGLHPKSLMVSWGDEVGFAGRVPGLETTNSTPCASCLDGARPGYIPPVPQFEAKRVRTRGAAYYTTAQFVVPTLANLLRWTMTAVERPRILNPLHGGPLLDGTIQVRHSEATAMATAPIDVNVPNASFGLSRTTHKDTATRPRVSPLAHQALNSQEADQYCQHQTPVFPLFPSLRHTAFEACTHTASAREQGSSAFLRSRPPSRTRARARVATTRPVGCAGLNGGSPSEAVEK